MSGVSSEPGKMWFNGWVWNSGSHSVTRLPLAVALRGRRREAGNDAFCHAMGVRAHFLTNCTALKFGGRFGDFGSADARCVVKVFSRHFTFDLSPFFFFLPGKTFAESILQPWSLTLRRESVFCFCLFWLDLVRCYRGLQLKPTITLKKKVEAISRWPSFD